MSFSLNLSSSEEEESDGDAKAEQSEFQRHIFASSEKRHAVAPTTEENVIDRPAMLKNDRSFSSGEDDDDDDIDWEDVDEDVDNDYGIDHMEKISPPMGVDDSSVTPAQPQPQIKEVVLDMNKDADDTDQKNKTEKSKRRRRVVKALRNVSPDTAALVGDIHRTHLLSLVARCITCSGISCSGNGDDLLLHVALSIVPDNLYQNENGQKARNCKQHALEHPNKDQVKKLFDWFTDLINNVQRRRAQLNANVNGQTTNRGSRRRGRTRKNQVVGSKKRKSTKTSDSIVDLSVAPVAPDDEHISHHALYPSCQRLLKYLEYLSPLNDYNESLPSMHICAEEKSLLFIAICRSLGWRARYVQSLRPVEKDLTVDHPLLAIGYRDIFRSVMSATSSTEASRTTSAPSSRKRPIAALSDVNNSDNMVGDFKCLAWAEILCTPSFSSISSSTWIHVDVHRELFCKPNSVESNKRSKKVFVSYVLGVEHKPYSCKDTDDVTSYFNNFLVSLTDVTPRYASAWTKTLQLRGATKAQILANGGRCADKWWSDTLRKANRLLRRRRKSAVKFETKGSQSHATLLRYQSGQKNDVIVLDDDSSVEKVPNVLPIKSIADSDDDVDVTEQKELTKSMESEAIPTSKVAFNNHPMFAIKSVLKQDDVLSPNAKKNICGMFKGEMVFRRGDVSKALTAKKWLYRRRKVKISEIDRPIKMIKARKKPPSRGFKALESYGIGFGNDGSAEARARDIENSLQNEEDRAMDKLYAIWQTDEWSPARVHPNEPIPVNEHNNVELELLNPGLVHLDERRISMAAKKLGILYAPCLLGFEGHGGNRVPVIRGIVVHAHNADLLREANVEIQSGMLEQDNSKRQHEIYSRWKRLIVGLLTKERLEKDYPDETPP